MQVEPTEWTLNLPWRTPPLSLNRNLHHLVQHRIRTELKTAGFALAKQQRVPALGAILAELVYYPGNNRPQDPDNLAPNIKPLIDGLRLAGVIPDDNATHVLRTSQRIIPRRDDPWGAGTGRMHLVITDASVLAPLPHVAPPDQGGTRHDRRPKPPAGRGLAPTP